MGKGREYRGPGTVEYDAQNISLVKELKILCEGDFMRWRVFGGAFAVAAVLAGLAAIVQHCRKGLGGSDPCEYDAVNMSLCDKSWCDILRAK